MNSLYRSYSSYLKEEYGEKVYKLPIKLSLTCPNRDGKLGYGGCIFCGEEGGSFENNACHSIKGQILSNKELIEKKYKAKKFIAYFQNFTNTYLHPKQFRLNLEECILDDIVGISISTRPDCISEEYLNILSKIKKDFKKDIIIELGLQTVNYKTLDYIQRGHGLAEFIQAMIKIKNYGFKADVHIIIGLPGDEMIDTIEASKILSVLQVDDVKLHSLYILKNTRLGEFYLSGKFQPITKEEYIKRVAYFIAYLDDNIAIQRIAGRAPKEDALFCNWHTSWWKLRDEIHKYMIDNNLYQGKYQDYRKGIVKKDEIN